MLFPSAKMIGRGGGGLDVDKVFATTLWTGNGANQQVNAGFTPDLSWHKARNTSEDNYLIDRVRGSFGLVSNSTAAQFDFRGQGPNNTGALLYGPNGRTYASWFWKRAKKFFDIVTYTGNGVAGRQIPHGLSVKPGMIILKQIDGTEAWYVNPTIRGNGTALTLNTANVEAFGGATASDALSFTLHDGLSVNGAGRQYVAYLFAHDPSPSGIIQCGQYTGNGSSIAGPVVELGWEPQWLLTKCINAARNWSILDNKRDTENPRFRSLIPNSTSPDQNSFDLDFTQTGFQPRSSSTEVNGSGNQYIYLTIRKGKA